MKAQDEADAKAGKVVFRKRKGGPEAAGGKSGADEHAKVSCGSCVLCEVLRDSKATFVAREVRNQLLASPGRKSGTDQHAEVTFGKP